MCDCSTSNTKHVIYELTDFINLRSHQVRNVCRIENNIKHQGHFWMFSTRTTQIPAWYMTCGFLLYFLLISVSFISHAIIWHLTLIFDLSPKCNIYSNPNLMFESMVIHILYEEYISHTRCIHIDLIIIMFCWMNIRIISINYIWTDWIAICLCEIIDQFILLLFCWFSLDEKWLRWFILLNERTDAAL